MNTKEYIQMQNLSGLQVGNTVKVLRGWKMGEFGFNRSYIGYYQKVNEINTIKEITDMGIAIEKGGATYPFFVLELVSKADVLMLNDKTAAIIQPDGNVTVGLETFKKEAVLALALRIQMRLAADKKDTVFPYKTRADKVPVGAIFEFCGTKFKQLREFTGEKGDCLRNVDNPKQSCETYFWVPKFSLDGDPDMTVTVLSHEEPKKKFVPYKTTADKVPVGAKFRMAAIEGVEDEYITKDIFLQLREFQGKNGDCVRLDGNGKPTQYTTFITTKDNIFQSEVEVLELKHD